MLIIGSLDVFLQNNLFSGQTDLHAILGEKKEDDLYCVLGELATLNKAENTKVALKARQVNTPLASSVFVLGL